MQKGVSVQCLIEKLAKKENSLVGHIKDIQKILAFFHCLLVLRLGACHLYAHGSDFLLILTYKASCMQKVVSVQCLIEKLAKKEYSFGGHIKDI